MARRSLRREDNFRVLKRGVAIFAKLAATSGYRKTVHVADGRAGVLLRRINCDSDRKRTTQIFLDDSFCGTIGGPLQSGLRSGYPGPWFVASRYSLGDIRWQRDSQHDTDPDMTTSPIRLAGAVEPALLDDAPVARMLDCSWRHIYRMADAGRLPRPIRFGSLVRCANATSTSGFPKDARLSVKGVRLTTPVDDRHGQNEGESRKDAAHHLLEAHRDVLIRRARRALLLRLLEVGIATADDVAQRIGPTDPSIDPRWLGTVPDRSQSPASYVEPTTRNRLDRFDMLPSSQSGIANRAAAMAWLARNPDLPEAEDDDGAPCPATPKPPSPTPLAVSVAQPNLC